MKKHILTAATAVFLILPLASQAADETKKKNAFTTADADGDGKVSLSEYVAAMKGKLDDSAARARFAELDKDKNGSLSRSEFSTATGAKKSGKKMKEAN